MDRRACDVSDGRMMNVSDDLITTAYCVREQYIIVVRQRVGRGGGIGRIGKTYTDNWTRVRNLFPRT